MNRYNGPIIVENVKTRVGRVYGNYAGNYRTYGSFAGELIKDNKIAYYPGLEVGNVDDKGRVSFTQIDLNHDGKISKEEIEDAAKELEKIPQAIKKMNKVYEKNDNRGAWCALGGFGFSAIVGAATAFVNGSALIATGACVGLFALPAAAVWYFSRKSNKQMNEVKKQCMQEMSNPYAKEQAMKRL